ncbi:MAG TPA: molybdopterin cofactor-binding domain-containing protein [Steroidobacteraceae bacterium]
MKITRRDFCASGGALILSFSIGAPRLKGAEGPRLPGSLSKAPYLDAWIRIDDDGAITVFTGKAELGQGIKTALIQVAAEELEVLPAAIHLITADTALTVNEGYTAGSHSLQDSGTAIRNAAAQVRELLIGAAASHWQVDATLLRAEQGAVIAGDGRSLKYAELVAKEFLHVQAQAQSKLKAAKDFRSMGRPMQRVDIPAKVTGGSAYVQDMRLPGMVHARMVRPPSPGASLVSLDSSQVESMPGVMKVVRNGNFLAVVATGEFQAVKAMRKLTAAARWSEHASLPLQSELPAFLTGLPAEDAVVIEQLADAPSAGLRRADGKILEATFTRAYQCHASMGPSCAVALFKGDALTVWNHSQGVYPNRAALAELLDMPAEKIRGIHTEGSGCYGHNGADDVAADAALIARMLPGTPVRVQWMREQEHLWEPFGPAMVTKVRATLDAQGLVNDWRYELWSNPHSSRPGPAAALLAARLIEHPFVPNPPHVQISPEGSGDRNSVPLYVFPGKHVQWHFLKDMPIRVSALRSLGAYMNVFSIESFMDELAQSAAADPVTFRLKHLQDPRAREVIQLAADKFKWGNKLPPRHGKGFAFARYKNLAAYCAVACEVSVELETGRIRLVRVVAAVDSGEIVNPDGIRNQTEGGILQSMSWTLYESVKFDATRITSSDWSTYPILRFASVPDSLEVHLIPRPGEPFLGAGEAAQGPGGAALANAVAHALGARIRDIPFTNERVRAALKANQSAPPNGPGPHRSEQSSR